MIFCILISFILAILAKTYSFFLLALYIPLILFLIKRKKEKKFIIASLISLSVGIGMMYLPHGSFGDKELIGLCVTRKENYIFLSTIDGKYLIYDDGQIPLFSIVKITGKAEQALFSHYESGFDFSSYLHTQGVFYELKAKEYEFIFDSHYNLSFLKSYSFSHLNESAELVIDSLLFSNSLYDLKEQSSLQALGLTSAFAVTGFHLSFFLNILKKLFSKKLKKSYEYLELSILFIFLFLSSFKYAIRRIFLLKAITLLNKKTGSRLSSLELLSLVCLFMLIIEPYSLTSSSFYYSFPFLFFLRIIQPRFRNKRSSFFLLILCFYFPIRILNSPRFYVLSPLSQIILLPFSHLIFLLSLPLLFIPQIGYLLNPLVNFYLSIIDMVCTNSPYLLNGSVSIFLALMMYMPIILFFVLRTYRYLKAAKSLAFSAIISTTLIFIPDFIPHKEINFIDVGQGDATLIRYNKTDILVDTGGNINIDLANECLIPYFNSKKITMLDAVIITHLDYDHYGALDKLKNNFQVGAVYYPEDFIKQPNEEITIGDINIKNLNIYSDGKDPNETSGVYYLELDDTKLLIMGDAPKEIENQIIEHMNIDIDIIKLGHHGSNTSSSFKFLKAITPELAIISCGYNNIYNHPSLETLDTLNRLNIPYRRTDLEGTISVKF